MTTNCSALEALLFASGEPVPMARISLILQQSDEAVAAAAEELGRILDEEGHSIQLLRLGDKLQLCSRAEYAETITKVLETRKPPALSAAAMETLAVVAYFQPVTGAYISKVRGVDSSYSISSLAEKGLIEVKDRLEAPGRPSLYGTTDLFLRTMQISELSELPHLPDLAASDGIEKLQKQIDALQEEKKDEQLPIPEITEEENKE